MYYVPPPQEKEGKNKKNGKKNNISWIPKRETLALKDFRVFGETKKLGFSDHHKRGKIER